MTRRELVCRLRGHVDDPARCACARCGLTDEAIRRGLSRREFDAYRERLRREGEAYWLGVQHGRRLDRKRTYLLGRRRGARLALAYMDEVLNRRAISEP